MMAVVAGDVDFSYRVDVSRGVTLAEPVPALKGITLRIPRGVTRSGRLTASRWRHSLWRAGLLRGRTRRCSAREGSHLNAQHLLLASLMSAVACSRRCLLR